MVAQQLDELCPRPRSGGCGGEGEAATDQPGFGAQQRGGQWLLQQLPYS